MRVAGLMTGGCRLRAQAGRDGLVTVVRPLPTLHRSALSAPTTRPAACAPVSYRPAGRGPRNTEHHSEGRDGAMAPSQWVRVCVDRWPWLSCDA